MAMAVKAFADLFTASLSTTGTRVNPAGFVEPVTTNVPRFDYDPVTLLPRGILVDASRTNLFLRSEEFGNEVWTKIAATVTDNAATSPDGTADADKLVEDTTTAIHYLSVAFTASAVTYAMSVYAKAGERSWLLFGNETDGQTAWFDVANGAVGSTYGGVTATITNAGSGWYRCSVTFTPTSEGGKTLALFLGNANNGSSYAGTSGNGMFLWGAQLEVGPYASSYIPTTSAAVARNPDNVTLGGAGFTGIYNATAGTFFADVEFPPGWTGVDNRRVLAAISGSPVAFLSTTGADSVLIWNGTTPVTKIGASNFAGRRVKMASAYSGGGTDLAVTLDGLAPTVSASAGSFSGITALGIGSSNGSRTLGGWIRNVRYIPRRLSNAELQAMTV